MPPELADVISLAVQTATAPLVTEVRELRARSARLVVLEQNLAMMQQSYTALVAEAAALTDRVKELEARPPTPGPPGPQGPQGEAGMRYLGVFQRGARYSVGDFVTCGGSMWHCDKPTEDAPREGAHDWTLAVKHGRDLRDPVRVNGGPH
jgi:hypothetical protein